jgi:hypothetical protein
MDDSGGEVTEPSDKFRQSAEYQLAERILKSWEAQPYDDESGFAEKVILARAYMDLLKLLPSAVSPSWQNCTRCGAAILNEHPEAVASVASSDSLNAEKDEAYRQRNVLVAALARLFPSGIRKTNIEDWSPDWHGCVYIDLPSGQISYHYHDSQAHLFADLPPYTKPWDGHDKATVEQRLALSCWKTGPLGMRVCEPACHSAAACLHPENCKADMTWENKRIASARPPSRDAVIEEVAKHIEASPLTYFGTDPGGVRDLRYLIVAAIRDLKGQQ